MVDGAGGFVSCMFASGVIETKLVLMDVSKIMLVGSRFLPTTVLAMLLWIGLEHKGCWKDVGYGVLYGISFFGYPMSIITLATGVINSGIIAMILGSAPMWTLIFGAKY